MNVEIDGIKYMKSERFVICDFFGIKLKNGDIIWDDSKTHFNIALSHIEFDKNKIYLVGQDDRKILLQNVILEQPCHLRYVKTA